MYVKEIEGQRVNP